MDSSSNGAEPNVIYISKTAELRKRQNLSQAELGKLVGLSASWVKKLDGGHGIDHFIKVYFLCEALGCSLKQLATSEQGSNAEIKQRRSDKGWSREQLAQEVGVSKNTIQNWEGSDSKIQNKLQNQLQLCECLKCELRDLFKVDHVRHPSVVSALPDLMDEKKLSFEQLSSDAQIPEFRLREWAKGENNKQLLEVLRLCEALNCDVRDLFQSASDMESQQPDT